MTVFERFLQALTVAGLTVYVLFVSGLLVVQAVWTALACRSRQALRYAADRWIIYYSALLYDSFSWINGVQTIFEPDWPALRALLKGSGKVVVVVNHQSAADIPITCRLLWLAGITNARWLVKRWAYQSKRFSWLRIPFACVPGIGWALWLNRSAFLERGGCRDDIRQIRACTQLAQKDGAAIVFFPEGTRLPQELSGASTNGQQPRFTLVPETGAVRLISKQLPEYAFVSITIVYKRPIPRGVWSLWRLRRTKVHVYWTYYETLVGQDARTWTQNEWEHKHNLLKVHHDAHLTR
ncbi:MAG: 1-acyl-sn-glycerol-3-phosphate acyltransferase [bacterium]|nr:1-acyl-sn-glycerol-3-phosphate acyltransferase [bacterium]